MCNKYPSCPVGKEAVGIRERTKQGWGAEVCVQWGGMWGQGGLRSLNCPRCAGLAWWSLPRLINERPPNPGTPHLPLFLSFLFLPWFLASSPIFPCLSRLCVSYSNIALLSLSIFFSCVYMPSLVFLVSLLLCFPSSMTLSHSPPLSFEFLLLSLFSPPAFQPVTLERRKIPP